MSSTHTTSSTLHSSSADLSSPSMASSVPRGHSPTDIQSHLYAAFLERRTADVALRIHGSWSAIYKLHRVILIQSGFFQSLFTSGFAESKSTLSSYRSGPEVIDLHFDDPNITRAAFEICIARLYGGGPPLYLSPTLCPTPAHPLTSSFPNASPATPPPPTHHPATPRLLLSLLATAVFLAVPSVAAHALNAVLASVGPYTAVRYLRFASGHGIGPPDASEPHAAVGLEGVAEPVTDTDDTASIASCATVRTMRTAASASTESELAVKEDPADTPCDSDDDDAPGCYYGAVSNKVGEAAACWLARWGVDMLRYEEQAVSIAAGPSATSRKRATTVPTRNGRSGEEDSSREWNRDRDREKEKEREAAKNLVIPRVWRRGGVSARWVRGLVSSDALFVRGERERFDLARAVVEMRRRDGVDADEEKEFLEMFTSGIYYANMSMGDLVSISRDVSPVTGKPYVPLGVLQAALWDQSVLRHRITSRQAGASSSAPGSQDKELGIALTTANILSVISSERAQDGEKERTFFAIPTDSSVRIGDSTGVEGASMEQLFELSVSPRAADSKKAPAQTSESNFFGLAQEQRDAAGCVAADATGTARWAQAPPFRFGVEFWDVDALKEKARLHSHTVWYAGSLFNVYVQVVRKKGVQLGVYLHRQSSVDPIPPSSAPAPPPVPRSMVHIPLSPSVSSPATYPRTGPPTRSSTPHTSPGSPAPASRGVLTHAPSMGNLAEAAAPAGAVAIPATAPPVMPPQPYRDPRAAVSAYFTIACASATGASLTRFASSPDVFSVSQSWGWKSSSLRTEEYLEVGPDGQPKAQGPGGREVSLRATVVLGVV